MFADEVPEVVDRLTAAIRMAPVDSAPTDNIFMDDVFAPWIYAEMLARLPGDDALDFIEHPDAVAPDGRKTRKLLDLTEESLARLTDDNDREFWRLMMQAFTAPALVAAIVDKFRPTLEARFGGEIPDMVLAPLIYRDYPGYRIGIHPDAAIKLATLQFYLPQDESQVHLGTTFHQRTEHGFEELKTNPFRPNSAYAFVRTDESWHSVKELGAGERIRNTIALTVYQRGYEYRSAPRGMM